MPDKPLKLINTSHVKRYALELADARPGNTMTRVSKEFFDGANAVLKAYVDSTIAGTPLDKGKTIYPLNRGDEVPAEAPAEA